MRHVLTTTAAIALAAGLASAASAQTMATQPNTATPGYGTQNTATNRTAQPSVTRPQAQAKPQQQMPNATSPGQEKQQAANDDFFSRRITNDQVRQAQQQLQAQGLYRGHIDGIVGDHTKQAIARFQRQNGLPVTATLDENTLNRLTNGAGTEQTTGFGSSTAQPETMPPASAGSNTQSSTPANGQPVNPTQQPKR